MKLRSERQSLERLGEVRSRLKEEITNSYEHRAASCVTCETPGACCLDAHFVNVRISRLEAVAINKFIDAREDAGLIRERIDSAIAKYNLSTDGEDSNKFACPLFERNEGCIVHHAGKPIPCIVHACYESAADLPPSSIADAAELAIENLNVRTYGRSHPLLPIPLAIKGGSG